MFYITRNYGVQLMNENLCQILARGNERTSQAYVKATLQEVRDVMEHIYPSMQQGEGQKPIEAAPPDDSADTGNVSESASDSLPAADQSTPEG